MYLFLSKSVTIFERLHICVACLYLNFVSAEALPIRTASDLLSYHSTVQRSNVLSANAICSLKTSLPCHQVTFLLWVHVEAWVVLDLVVGEGVEILLRQFVVKGILGPCADKCEPSQTQHAQSCHEKLALLLVGLVTQTERNYKGGWNCHSETKAQTIH